jgi:hypothetical protein
MQTSNASIFRRHEQAQHAMALLTLPRCGVVEYDSLIPRVPLTGRVWRDGKVTVRPRPQQGGVR